MLVQVLDFSTRFYSQTTSWHSKWQLHLVAKPHWYVRHRMLVMLASNRFKEVPHCQHFKKYLSKQGYLQNPTLGTNADNDNKAKEVEPPQILA